MTFLSPERLWLLGLLPALVAVYVLMQLRRRNYAVRFTNLALLSQVAPRRPGWRRHVAAALLVSVHVSLAMVARYGSPSRFEAAKAAAKKFIGELPARFNVGVVAFAGNANLVAAPSDGRTAAIASLDQLALAKRTAIGEAVFTSLQAVQIGRA